jgi:hypothetical protein
MPLFDQQLAIRVAGAELERLGYDVPKLPPFDWPGRIQYNLLAVRFRLLDVLRRGLYAVGWLKMSRDKRARRS